MWLRKKSGRFLLGNGCGASRFTVRWVAHGREREAAPSGANTTTLPLTVDWSARLRSLGRVHFQGNCGSCWAIASASALEASSIEPRSRGGRSFLAQTRSARALAEVALRGLAKGRRRSRSLAIAGGSGLRGGRLVAADRVHPAMRGAIDPGSGSCTLRPRWARLVCLAPLPDR